MPCSKIKKLTCSKTPSLVVASYKGDKHDPPTSGHGINWGGCKSLSRTLTNSEKFAFWNQSSPLEFFPKLLAKLHQQYFY